MPRFRAVLQRHYQGSFDGHKVTHCPIQTNERGEHLLSLLGPRRLKAVLLNELDALEGVPVATLLDNRYRRLRGYGAYDHAS